MQRPLYTDFTAGEISPKLSGSVDLALYKKSCDTLKNFQPMTQRGIRRRPGTQYIADLSTSVRLIPFVVDATNYFLIELSNLKMRIWQNDELVDFGSGVTEKVTTYGTSEIDDIHHTQSYDQIFFTHKSHPIGQLIYSGGSFTWGALSISGRSGQSLPFGSAGNYPKTCAIISGRLWFASSSTQPATIWGSVPFDYDNFTDYDIITVNTIEYTDPEGWADASIPEYAEVAVEEESYTPANAIEITLGSDKNEEIKWISGQRDIIVGTLTGEYVIPGTIDALNQSARLQSRFGSAAIQARVVGNAILFVQSDKKKLREFYYSEEGGYQSPDLTWAADHMLQGNVADFDFQRTPDPRVFCVLEDGTMKVLSYSRLYDVVGWSPWETEGTFDQVCILDAPNSQTVYVVVTREGTRRLEKLYEPYSDLYHLDCASSVISDSEGVITYPFVSTKWVVMDSSYDLVTTPAADTAYTIGMLLTSDTILNRLPHNPTRTKRMTELRVRVVASGAFTAGYKDRLYANVLKTGQTYPFTGDVRVPLSGEYDSDAQIEIKIATHKPLMITALVPDVEVF